MQLILALLFGLTAHAQFNCYPPLKLQGMRRALFQSNLTEVLDWKKVDQLTHPSEDRLQFTSLEQLALEVDGKTEILHLRPLNPRPAAARDLATAPRRQSDELDRTLNKLSIRYRVFLTDLEDEESTPYTQSQIYLRRMGLSDEMLEFEPIARNLQTTMSRRMTYADFPLTSWPAFERRVPTTHLFHQTLRAGALLIASEQMVFILSRNYEWLTVCPQSEAITKPELILEMQDFLGSSPVMRFLSCEALLVR